MFCNWDSTSENQISGLLTVSQINQIKSIFTQYKIPENPVAKLVFIKQLNSYPRYQSLFTNILADLCIENKNLNQIKQHIDTPILLKDLIDDSCKLIHRESDDGKNLTPKHSQMIKALDSYHQLPDSIKNLVLEFDQKEISKKEATQVIRDLLQLKKHELVNGIIVSAINRFEIEMFKLIGGDFSKCVNLIKNLGVFSCLLKYFNFCSHNRIAITKNQFDRFTKYCYNLDTLIINKCVADGVDITSIQSLTSLVELNLFNNALSSLPDSIRSLTSLKRLYLANNEFTSIPKAIESLTSLQVLDLESNELTSFPESLGSLASLEELKLRYNQLISLSDDIGAFSSLTKLDLGNNKLASLPSTIGLLASLIEFRVGINELTTLPDSIGSLTSLVKLELHYNKLVFLPPTIESLTILKVLLLSNNQLAFLPRSIGSLVSVSELDLKINELTFLPDAIGLLTSLVKLDLERNELGSLPDTIGSLTALVDLNVNHNHLISLPTGIGFLSSLEMFHLGKNDLISVPDSIGSLTSLKTLELWQNPLSFLPESIGGLSSLTSLDLGNTKITFLPNSITDITGLLTVFDTTLDNILIQLRLANAYEIDETFEGTYPIQIADNPEHIDDNYFAYLNYIAGSITLQCSDFIVKHKTAQDIGGVCKDFISHLFEAFAKNHVKDDHTPSWKVIGTPIHDTEQLEELYESIGRIMAFIVRVKGKYPIGPIFNSSVFNVIKNYASDIEKYEDLDLESLMSLSAVQPSGNLRRMLEVDIIPFLKAKGANEASENFTRMSEGLIDTLSIINAFPDHFLDPNKNVDLTNQWKELQTFVYNQLRDFEPIQEIVKPILHIVNGFKSLTPVWKARQRTDLHLEDRIQGRFNAQLVIDNITFETEEGKPYAECVQEWVRGKMKKTGIDGEVKIENETAVRNLLWYTTGAKSLSYDPDTREFKKIVIVPVYSLLPVIVAHTCFNRLDVPKGLTKEQLFKGLDNLAVISSTLDYGIV
jgi:Leucine-rich repeat (LRR) protein